MADTARRAALERLKTQVRAIEIKRGDDDGGDATGRVSLGAPELDRTIAGGLAPGLHELRPSSYFDAPAAVLTLAGLLARAARARPGPVLWAHMSGPAAAHDFGAPDPHGLAALGLDPARVALVEARDARALLWAMEEGARSRGVAAVAGEIGASAAFDRVAARRLQLAARRAGGLVIALRGARGHVPSPALTRWAVAARPGGAVSWRGADAVPGLGPARLALTLERAGDVQGGLVAPRTFDVEWVDAADGFRLAGAMADRPARADGEGELSLAGGRLPLAGERFPLRRAG